MTKYYWYLLQRLIIPSGEILNDEDVSKNDHPFYCREDRQIVLDDASKGTGLSVKVILLNWKEITKEEYSLFQKTRP